ncbi:hypothetical protein AWV79_15715 [Cupriavidus sp. UYMMa02A]|nr:hypothetical protein AWV79_15715 [Cupriavidus sp. UYMMa02A]
MPSTSGSGTYRGYVGPQAQPDTGEPPRQWDRALPFFAQRVIDKGYDLPNPYDIGYSYFDGPQRYQLSGLQVSGGNAPLRPADFVRFDQSRIHNRSNGTPSCPDPGSLPPSPPWWLR